MVNGKAKLLREDYCDGLGDCLPACPTGAIRFEMREAPAYDEAAVKAAQQAKGHGGCPGSRAAALKPHGGCPGSRATALKPAETAAAPLQQTSQLGQWPVQIKLAPVHAPYFSGASLLVAADCTAYAYASFHQDFMRGKITLIGCPKLDEGDYAEKLTEIIRQNDIKSVTVVRMEVPCCGGIENAVKRALMQSGKFLPWRVVTLSVDGRVISD